MRGVAGIVYLVADVQNKLIEFLDNFNPLNLLCQLFQKFVEPFRIHRPSPYASHAVSRTGHERRLGTGIGEWQATRWMR